MTAVLPRIERQKYAVAQEWIRDGRWTVDESAGTIHGFYDQPIGWVAANRVRVAVVIRGKPRMCLRSRVIYEHVHGEIAPGLEVVHRNSPLDDSIDNLMVVSTPRAHNRNKFTKSESTGRFLRRSAS